MLASQDHDKAKSEIVRTITFQKQSPLLIYLKIGENPKVLKLIVENIRNDVQTGKNIHTQVKNKQTLVSFISNSNSCYSC